LWGLSWAWLVVSPERHFIPLRRLTPLASPSSRFTPPSCASPKIPFGDKTGLMNELNGNVLGYTDTVIGAWSFGYDSEPLLTSAANTSVATGG